MIDEELRSPTGSLNPLYQEYERQKCFVGYSLDTPWCEDLIAVCGEVLEEFDMEPWYATEHFVPTQSLREKVVELIANTRYGLYDLSCWRKDEKSKWHMPRNVFIELGIAIALNRPILLLRHTSNRIAELQLPQCLESISTSIAEFSGLHTLKSNLRERLSQWQQTEPEKDWWNRYCSFGNRVCEYREAHPHLRQWGQEKLHCHISDGQDFDRADFRAVVEEVLQRFDDVNFRYLDGWCPLPEGYTFLLCGLCQTIRSSPFAIYRISDQTPAETFIAIGMSLALETQFEHKIPKILLTAHAEDIPSLLAGYDVVVAQNDRERLSSLRKFTPKVIHQVRKTTWKARPLPFIVDVPHPDEQPVPKAASDQELEGEYLAMVGKYGLIKEIGRSEIAVTYLVLDTENKQTYAMKRLHSSLAADLRSVTRFQGEAATLSKLNDPHIVRGIEQGEDGAIPYFVMEYVEGQTLKHLMQATGPMEAARAINYARQIAEGLDAAYRLDIIHHDIEPEHILVDSQDQVKITGFGSTREREVDDRNSTQANEVLLYSIAPEVVESSRNADIRSDLYALAVMFFDMLAGQLPFSGENSFTIIYKHLYEPVPSLCLLRPDLLGVFDLFMQKAMTKSPGDRYQTPAEFIAALDQLQAAVTLAPPDHRALVPVNEGRPGTHGLPVMVGKTLGQYRIFDYLGSNGLSDVLKAYEPALDRVVALKIFSSTLLMVPGFGEIFVQEFRTLAHLSHPHLVPVYDFDVQDDIPYSVEEFIDDGSFRRRLKTSIGQQKAVEYVIQAAEGLQYLHSNGLVHQDVRPENMLLRSDDHLLLSNWGTLNVFKTAQVPLSYSSTYCSPEQDEGQQVEHRSNVYSLGMILFDCLTSRDPSLTPSYPGAITRDPKQPFRIWDLRSANVPVEIQQVIVKMTRKQPEERYQSMQEVIEALRAALAATEQAQQEESTVVVGMDRCAFCDATTTPEDELCANCGNRLLPEKSYASYPAPAYSYSPNATIQPNICTVCGAEFRPGDVSCPNCGNIPTVYAIPSVTQQPSAPWSPIPYVPQPGTQIRYCPNCGAATWSDEEICDNCGRPVPPPPVLKTCPYCSFMIREDDQFCMNCGRSLVSPPNVPESPSGALTVSNSEVWDGPQPSPVDSWASPSPDDWTAKPFACPHCGGPAWPGDSLCRHCGNSLLTAPAQPSSGQAVSPPDPWRTPPPPDPWSKQSPAARGAQSSPPPSGLFEVQEPTVEADNDDQSPPDAAEGEEALAPVLPGRFGSAWTGGPSTLAPEDLNNIGKIFGSYRILRDIGQGGLGRVYLALHTTSYQAAAVKLFYSHLDSKQRQNLFFLGTQVLDQLRHPHIMSIIEVNLHENPLYLITEYASLGSLHDRIQSGQPLPRENAITILSQIGEALAHIHQHNIIHRDLKPGNILFNDRNEALLSDFDIAVVLDTGDSKKVNKWGSPPYMAPEQFEGVVSRQSDQYSLGCIAYRLFTGRRPFDDTNFMVLQYKHMTQEPIAPHQLNPDIPEHIEQAILKAMAKKPADRFADMLAFIVALKSEKVSVVQGQPRIPPAAPHSAEAPLLPQPVPVANGIIPPTPVGDAAQKGEPHQGPASQKERVLVEIDGRVVKEQSLNKPILTVGRLSDNDISVPVESVSRLHAEIRWENGAWLIKDDGSLNGISYEGNRIPRYGHVVLKNGDRIMLAPRTILLFNP